MTERTQRGSSMPMCPMAKMCMGMMENRFSGVLFLVPGLSLIGVGVLILVEPLVLAWLVAAASVLVGGMLLAMAVFVRRFTAQRRA